MALLVHEAAHGRHTCWDFGTGSSAAAEAATILEESRIETAQIGRRPGDRRWLRAASTTILLRDIPPTDDRWAAAGTAALILGRADAGILDSDEVQPVRDAVTNILGATTLDQLTEIWQLAHRTGDCDTDGMLELGRRWCAVLGIDPDNTTLPPRQPPGGADTGTAGTPAGSTTGRPAGGGVLRRAAGQVAGTVAVHDQEHARAQADAAQRAQQKAAARAAEARAQNQAGAAAAAVFGNTAVRGNGRAVRRARPNPRTRAATDAARAAARELARALRAAAYREPTDTVVDAPAPPGRLRARAAMSADAQRAAGQEPTAQPWRRTERRRHPHPPVHVGICVDVSPSVSSFADPIASAAWITAQATAWAGGTSATITFGAYVTAITRPGQPPAQVRLFDRENNTAGFPLAVDALDGALDLANPRAGARLLVVVSDGEFTDQDTTGGQQRLDRLLRTGCALLWPAPPGSTPLAGGQQVTLTDPSHSARLIARAATAALANHP
ncbi:hypothetical protein AB0M20_01200 [Actinoplanes sp. NPDC051633]|uniref:hypothetical protein n=1 Tax=Actinoplanes sp. NPDC051633 TaxID=3155670 RepID=UPI003418139D